MKSVLRDIQSESLTSSAIHYTFGNGAKPLLHPPGVTGFSGGCMVKSESRSQPLRSRVIFLTFIFTGDSVISHSIYSDQKRVSVQAELLLLFWFWLPGKNWPLTAFSRSGLCLDGWSTTFQFKWKWLYAEIGWGPASWTCREGRTKQSLLHPITRSV